jgi:hypothetical protein
LPPPPHVFPESRFAPHVDAVHRNIKEKCGEKSACADTAAEIIKAAELWLETMKKNKVSVPDYINDGYAIRVAGIESSLNPNARRMNPNRKWSTYEGLMQYSRRGGRFWDSALQARLIPYLNQIKGDIPALGAIPDINAAALKKEEVFRNIHVQVAAAMFNALHDGSDIQSYPQLKTLAPEHEQAWLYLYHNLPDAARAVRDNLSQDRTIAELAPQHRTYYGSNSTIYDGGDATPQDILQRVARLTKPYVDRFYPEGQKSKPLPVRNSDMNTRRQALSRLFLQAG